MCSQNCEKKQISTELKSCCLLPKRLELGSVKFGFALHIQHLLEFKCFFKNCLLTWSHLFWINFECYHNAFLNFENIFFDLEKRCLLITNIWKCKQKFIGLPTITVSLHFVNINCIYASLVHKIIYVNLFGQEQLM